MTGPDQDMLVTRIRAELDRQTDTLDELTLARLRAARLRAVAAAGRPRRHWLPVLGAAVAAAIVAAVLLWQQPASLPGTADDIDIVASGDDLDMFEELDFYDWLDESQTSG